MRTIMTGFACILTFVLCLLPLSASAQSKKELAAQALQLSQRLTVLENRLLTGDPAAEQLMQRMDALEASQRSLTGELERVRYERDNLQEEVQALAVSLADMQAITSDMKRHLKAVNIVSRQPSPIQQAPRYSGQVNSGTVYGGTTQSSPYQNGSSSPYSTSPSLSNALPAIVAAPVVASNDISQLGKIGLEKMQEGNFGEAQSSFKQYLEHNPAATDRGDVYFWLGETYYVKGGYADAAESYIASMRAQPKGDYAPEAMIRLAGTARALGKKQAACQTINSFSTQYPNATPAVRAKARTERQRSGC